jgi:hypothetical protein
MKIDVSFPESAAYRISLGQLRKALKAHIAHLHIRKRAGGVLITGAPEKVTAAILILPPDYTVINVTDPENRHLAKDMG